MDVKFNYYWGLLLEFWTFRICGKSALLCVFCIFHILFYLRYMIEPKIMKKRMIGKARKKL